ncbi:MAG: hypothetical protein H0U23_15895 [Blastocatellia bacterium]|nr:hypothetical protein [Blastocatellia bacterium]
MSQNELLSSTELARLTGFDRRHIPRKAEKGKIPDARRTKSGRWEFPMTENLRAWICFYRVRHALLRKVRSSKEEQTLRDWGTNWKTALATYKFFAMPFFEIFGFNCGPLGIIQLGRNCTWEEVEAVVLSVGLMPDKDRRSDLIGSAC